MESRSLEFYVKCFGSGYCSVLSLVEGFMKMSSLFFFSLGDFAEPSSLGAAVYSVFHVYVENALEVGRSS